MKRIIDLVAVGGASIVLWSLLAMRELTSQTTRLSRSRRLGSSLGTAPPPSAR
jgi:hypothetical protein